MEGSMILILKRANQEGAAPQGVPAVPASSGDCAPKGSSCAGKENSPQQARAPPLGRVREAALALERLTKAESEQDKGRGKGGAGSKEMPGVERLTPELLRRGCSLSGPLVVEQQVGGRAACVRAEALGTKDGQGEKHVVHDPAVPTGSCQSSESVERLVTQPASPVSDTPRSVLGPDEGPWGVTLSRPTSGRHVLRGGKSEPAAAGGPVPGASAAAGGSKEEGGRRSMRSLLQLWTRQEASAAAPASQPKSVAEKPPAALNPLGQPGQDRLSLAQEVGPFAQLESTTVGAEAEASHLAPQQKGNLPAVPARELGQEGGAKYSSGGEPGSCVPAGSELLSAPGQVDEIPQPGQQPLGGERAVAPEAPIAVETETPTADREDPTSSPARETLPSAQEHSSPKVAEGNKLLVLATDKQPTLATPPGVAGIFFRPKKVAWRAEAMEWQSTLERQNLVPGAALGASRASADVINRDVEPELEQGGDAAVATELAEKADVMPLVLRPTNEKHSPLPLDALEESVEVGTCPAGSPSPVRAAAPSPGTLVLLPEVQGSGSFSQTVATIENGPTSPPPTPAATMYSSPASLKRGLLLVSAQPPRSGDGSCPLATQTAVSGIPADAESPPMEQRALSASEEALSPVAHRPLLPASSFFSPISAGRADTRAVDASLPSLNPQTLSRQPGSSPLLAPGSANKTPAEPVIYCQQGQSGRGVESPPASPASPPPASPRLASASPFFSPQAVRTPSTPGAARSLFSSGGVGETLGPRFTATADLGGSAKEGPSVEVGDAVRDVLERVDSPPPLAASHFFSPRKVAPLKQVADLRTGFAGLVSSGLSGGYPAQIQEPEGVLLAISQSRTGDESSSSDHSAADAVDAVRQISPPPACAIRFFSPSQPAFSRAFNRSETGRPSLDLGNLESAPAIVPGVKAEVFYDVGEDVTPYASANCSPMSVPGSSPGSERLGPSRRVWEAVQEEAALPPSGKSRTRAIPGASFDAVKTVARGRGEGLVADTWQSDGGVSGPGAGFTAVGEGNGSELRSSHVSDWDTPDHQKVRTPPYRSGVAGMWGQEAEPAPFPHTGAGLLAQAKPYPDGEGALADVYDSLHSGAEAADKEAEAEKSAAPPKLEKPTLEMSGHPIGTFGSSAEGLLQSPGVAPRSTGEEPVSLPLGGMAAWEAFAADGTPPPAQETPAAAPRDTTPSPSKPGLWSTFVGGLRGMITPPKLTPQKRAGPSQATAAGRSAKNGPTLGGQVEVASGGAFRPTWASPEKERQIEGACGGGVEEGALAEGGPRKEPNGTVNMKAPDRSQWTASFPPTPASQPASRTVAAEDTTTAQTDARGDSVSLPAGSPERQRSASPRTPPLASQAFGFASRNAAPQPTPVRPEASQPQPMHTPEAASPEPQPEAEAPAAVDFSPWERLQMAAIFEHFQGATSQRGARAFFAGDRGTQQNDGPPGEGPVQRSGSAGSADSCFELAPHKVFKGADETDDSNDVIDPIVRAVLGVPGGRSPLVNYYDVAETAPSVEAAGVKTFTGRIPISKPREGEIPNSKPLERIHSGVRKPGKAGVTVAYPWVTHPSPTLTRWLQSDRYEEASFWAPPPKPEPVPNWARGAPGKDGAFVGCKTGGPLSAAPTGPIPFPNISGDLQAVRPAQESPKRPAQGSPANARTRKGPVPIDQRKPRHDPNKKYFPARVNELRGARGGEAPAANQGGAGDGGLDAGRDSFLAPAGSPNQIHFGKQGRSASVTDRAHEQRSAAREGLKAFRSLTPLRFRSAKADPNRESHGTHNVALSRSEAPSPAPVTHSPAQDSPAKTRPLFRRTSADSVPAAGLRQSPASVDLGEDKENASEVSGPASDVSKMKQSEAGAGDPGAKRASGFGGSPDCFDRALSLRDPNREPALMAEYVDRSPKEVPIKPKAAAEAASLWEPAVSDVDAPSAWAHLSPADLVARPLPSPVAVCRCYVTREHASKLGTSGLYTLFTQEGEGRQDRLLLVARHVRHVGRSEFVIADSAEKLGEKGGPRCVVRANFVGSKYTAHTPDAEGKITEETKLAEIGYATTATSLAPTSRRMLVTLPVTDGAQEPPLALVSKAPVFNQELKRFEINYGGRAKDGAGIQQSVKNFQLVAEAAEDRTLLLFGKVGKDVFVMDFRPPFSATQAFAICLSSVDSKLCCAL